MYFQGLGQINPQLIHPENSGNTWLGNSQANQKGIWFLIEKTWELYSVNSCFRDQALDKKEFERRGHLALFAIGALSVESWRRINQKSI